MRPLKVFLCHAHADRDPVHGLYTRLTNDGVDAWFDKAKLLPGQDWKLEIEKAVREADVVVVCLSKQFNQAGFRQKEVRLALDTAMEKPEGEIFIIPARLEECDNLESLRRWHWVDLFEDDGYERIMRTLRARADTIDAVLQVKRNQSITISTSHTKPSNKLKLAVISAIIGLFVIICLALASSFILEKLTTQPTATPHSVGVITSYPGVLTSIPAGLELTLTEAPTQDANQNLVSTVIFTPTAYAGNLSTEIVDPQGVQMRLVPAGDFLMGADSDFSISDEKPIHVVYLDAFYMDTYEVTNALYEMCVDAMVCDAPKQSDSYTHPNYYGNPQFDNYPVIYVDWYMAKTYCEWRDSELPTEAQWEKAARGTDGRTYPWGDGLDCKLANYFDGIYYCVGDTVIIGAYRNDNSPYEIYDMSGNVFEWVADWYSETYYKVSPSSNPLGPDMGQQRVFRGGSWAGSRDGTTRASLRSGETPDVSSWDIGFRCARAANP